MLRPDSYVGSVDSVTKEMWVWDAKKNKIVNKTISYVPGLFKIFGKLASLAGNKTLPTLSLSVDEIIVNAADNFHRDRKMTQIKVKIDSEKNKISVWNNGKGIPI